MSGLTALFVRQPDRILLPYNPEAGADTHDDEEISVGNEEELEQSAEFVLEAHLEEFLVGQLEVDPLGAAAGDLG